MKKLITNFILLVATVVFTTSGIAPTYSDKVECNSKALKKEGITELSPYYYSSAKVTDVRYRDTAYNSEIVVPLFKGEEYRMIFNGKSLPAGIEINIYDVDKSHENRKPLYSTTSSTNKLIVYEPKRSKRHYISYRIPAGKNIEDACMVFVLGYKLTFVKEVD